MEKKGHIPPASSEILSHPYVQYLHGVIEGLVAKVEKLELEVSELKEELAAQKNLPKRPKIKASALDKEKPDPKTGSKKGASNRKKKKDLPIDETRKIVVRNVPRGWVLIGYQPYVIQDIVLRRNNIKYEREIWESPDGRQRIVADLPESVRGRDFGEELRRYIINLYNECHVTQPIIHNHLINLGVEISSGAINFILNEDKANEIFDKELRAVVEQGMAVSDEIRTDDTGARHKGKNGFCNCINSDLFTYFVSTSSKSRINFLSILQLNKKDYHINEAALSYIASQGLTEKYLSKLSKHKGRVLEAEAALTQFLQEEELTAKHAVRTITEGLMIGSLIAHGFDKEKVIHSDGAAQFNLFNHALCWKHAERPLIKLRIHNDIQQKLWDEKVKAFWQLYQDLKAYKQVSWLARKRRRPKLEKQFERLCEPVNNFAALNFVLEDLKNKKEELLLVLQFPFASLNNNSTERQIREYVKRRKISGSTRSDNGRKYRDVFTSLKKTCKKLGVSFWDYLLDRIKRENNIPPLDQILVQQATLSRG